MVSMNLEKYDSCLVLVELQKLKLIYSEKATKNMKKSANFFWSYKVISNKIIVAFLDYILLCNVSTFLQHQFGK